MRLIDGSELSNDQIESLNAHGPYSMAVWRSGDIEIGNEEGLLGRSSYFLKLIREEILKNYSLEELKNFSILDIGCNDGWVLHELSDLPFKKMVGLEPREKNIAKGKMVREILKLQNRVDYRIGDVESLDDEKFDIVICAGVLYHVESIPLALRNIRNICNKFLFIESRCLSEGHITSELMDEIEMRDLVYQFKEKICGITAQKFESGYHDGSAKEATIVNIPSVESLVMNLELLSFQEINVVASTREYRAAVWQDKRPLSGVCITALIPDKLEEQSQTTDEESVWIQEYENGLAAEILPRDFLEPIYRAIVLKNSNAAIDPRNQEIVNLVNSKKLSNKNLEELLPSSAQGKYFLEIVRNLSYSPSDKISLEFGKLLSSEGKYQEALDVLRGITSKLNADWRSTYRSFFETAKIYQILNDSANAEKYYKLCLICNPKFPI
jgi:ubiquinone/menaquinone biosynthesis C-methylase UbiE